MAKRKAVAKSTQSGETSPRRSRRITSKIPGTPAIKGGAKYQKKVSEEPSHLSTVPITQGRKRQRRDEEKEQEDRNESNSDDDKLPGIMNPNGKFSLESGKKPKPKVQFEGSSSEEEHENEEEEEEENNLTKLALYDKMDSFGENINEYKESQDRFIEMTKEVFTSFVRQQEMTNKAFGLLLSKFRDEIVEGVVKRNQAIEKRLVKFDALCDEMQKGLKAYALIKNQLEDMYVKRTPTYSATSMFEKTPYRQQVTPSVQDPSPPLVHLRDPSPPRDDQNATSGGNLLSSVSPEPFDNEDEVLEDAASDDGSDDEEDRDPSSVLPHNSPAADANQEELHKKIIDVMVEKDRANKVFLFLDFKNMNPRPFHYRSTNRRDKDKEHRLAFLRAYFDPTRNSFGIENLVQDYVNLKIPEGIPSSFDFASSESIVSGVFNVYTLFKNNLKNSIRDTVVKKHTGALQKEWEDLIKVVSKEKMAAVNIEDVASPKAAALESENEASGNEASGNEASGNEASGNEASENEDSGEEGSEKSDDGLSFNVPKTPASKTTK